MKILRIETVRFAFVETDLGDFKVFADGRVMWLDPALEVWELATGCNCDFEESQIATVRTYGLNELKTTRAI